MSTTTVHYLLSFILCSTYYLLPVRGSVKGAVPLDEFTFDRIISKFDTVLVKFDAVYPYGEAHDAFNKVTEELKTSDDILLAEVGIKDFGEHDNQKLGERFGIMSKKDWPALRLFVKGEDEPFSMNNNHVWNVDEIKKFIKEHSNVYLGLTGCSQSFDRLAGEFAGAIDKEAILKLAEKTAEGLTNENEKRTAAIYIKYMKKALEKETFVEDEKKRLKKIMESKIKEEKKQDLQVRSNILSSFTPLKTEL
ncbi:endoplasmic reticulum resident protein 29 [Anthonomus grandis grandis]|uniref:endoplasmic reticulum resident protein 29 n=1 Tax=Anthonomus grandis grandis TaxID=2921223 RepID=UPI0021663831|nr:endoplasmic reticulum resident protein 29 [Anthonomus grandis grandis]